MSYYTYVEPDENNRPVYVTMSEDEILAEYWDSWRSRMIVKFGEEHFNATYSRHECIEDWCVIHWAWSAGWIV
jgi:hypothetical protein